MTTLRRMPRALASAAILAGFLALIPSAGTAYSSTPPSDSARQAPPVLTTKALASLPVTARQRAAATRRLRLTRTQPTLGRVFDRAQRIARLRAGSVSNRSALARPSGTNTWTYWNTVFSYNHVNFDFYWALYWLYSPTYDMYLYMGIEYRCYAGSCALSYAYPRWIWAYYYQGAFSNWMTGPGSS